MATGSHGGWRPETSQRPQPGRRRDVKISTAISMAALAVSSLAVAAVPAAAQGITDPQIASIVVTANQVDIDAGMLAAARSGNAQVKAFGEMMVKDHTGVNKSATELATRLKVTPQDNPTSQ